VDFTVYEDEILMLMGPNGAGKSTVLKALFGMLSYTTGHITFEGERIKPVPREMVKRGVSFVSQSERIFPDLSVRENLLMGAITMTDKFKIERKFKEVCEFFPVLGRKKAETVKRRDGE